jgi:FtsH-binding integral membrane protein
MLIILQLVLVVALAGWTMRMALPVAAIVFLGYAALTGLTLSTIFLVYTAASIAKVFAITAGAFGALSIYGFTTKRDLSAWAGFLFMSLIGLIIASVVNIWFQSPMIDWITTFGGIVIFAGLTAYDTQKLRALNQIGNMDSAEDHKEAIRGALTLYLDFINLFLHLLRVLGNRR